MAKTSAGAVRVQVLGPVRVAGSEGWVDVPGVNGKALIVSLVLAKGAVVSVPSLVDDIWQDDPPRNARAALQTLVSRVRAVAGDELIESLAGGYRLGASTAEIDLWSPDAARRGEPGADLGETELATRLRETADGVRVRALEQRATDAAGSGSAAEAVAAARALAAATPYDERAQLLLMKSLAADGRRGEALRAFAEFRQRLDDELGARPGAELVACNAELLRADSSPAALSESSARGTDPDSAERIRAAQPGSGGAGAPKHVAIGLRAAPNELIGRADDIAALERLMAASRLTTILGPGGLGKTRLAQELANRAARATPGVVVVELAGIRESDDVPLAVAATLGIGEVGAGRLSLRDPIVLLEVRTRIRAALAERETLLVLDNCEHVIEGAAYLVDQVLSEIPTVRVLATSRSPLQLGAESVYPLGPLPADEHGPAVTLFLERARAARPGAALPLDAVARLCDHLDGLPLAIELAAARIRSMSVDEIERRLSNRFALLRGGDRSAPERHRTLIAVIDWSWNLLSESERRMLRRLSRFPDGFSAVAAAAVMLVDADPAREEEARLAASDDLDALVLQSLVSVTETPTGLRYRMLETVREFGDMALVDAGEDELVAAAQSRWAQRFASEAIAGLPSSRQSAVILAVNVEHDNLVAVLRAHDSDPAIVVPVFGALLFHWLVRNQIREALSFAPIVARVVAAGEPPAEFPDASAIALMFAAIMGIAGSQAPGPGHRSREQRPELPPELAEFDAVPPTELLRAGLRAGVKLRRLVRSGAVSPWLAALAEVLSSAARYQAEWGLWQLESLRGSDDDIVRILGHLFSGLLSENTGELERSLRHVTVAWEGSARLGLDWVAGQAAQGIANLCSQDDRPADALEWAERSRERLASIGAIEEIGQSDWITAINRLKLGRRDGVADAFERFANDDEPREGFDGPDTRAIGWACLAELAAADGDTDRAVELYRTAVQLYGAKPGAFALGAWYLISSAGALAASVYYERMDDAALTIARTLRLNARVAARGRGRGGPAMVDRPVLATAAAGLAIWLLGRPGATDAERETGVELLALAERLHSRQDQPSLVRARAFALAEGAVGASAVVAARERVAALPDLAACTTALDELLRVTRF